MSTMKYRADIDGLRAIAVAAVILFHCGATLVPGGYVGVDIFFVISGFLITSMIRTETQIGSFSLAGFYERRFRRIFPALIAVLAVLWLAGFLVLSPGEHRELSKETLAAALSVSNFLFWNDTGYFEAAAITKPLLHTWSLGVEEQFYLLLPLALLIAPPRRAFATIAALAAASFALNCWMLWRSPEAAFYLLPARIWEFLVGGLLSFRRFSIPDRVAALAGPAGAALLTASILIPLDHAVRVLAVLAACFGTVLVIAAGDAKRTAVTTALSAPLLGFIGRISYSLYLWHWPVLIALKRSLFELYPMPRWGVIAIVSAISTGLAWVTWRYVEIPFRTKACGRSTLRVAGFATLAVISFSTARLAIPETEAAYPTDLQTLQRYATDYDFKSWFRSTDCFVWSGSSFEAYRKDQCLAIDSRRKNYLIVGDSHAAHLWHGLSTVYDSINWLQATSSGCTPGMPTEGAERCVRMMDFIFNDFLRHTHVDLIVLSAHWTDHEKPLPGLLALIRQLRIPVVMVGPIVNYDTPVPTLLLDAARLRDPAIPGRHLIESERNVDRLIASLAAQAEVPYISMFEMLCGSTACRTWLGKGIPLQFDLSHLTKEGSVFVAQQMKARHLLPD
jgi:peptidoglycan/LPS O-acetylase OafA/YrhL